MHSLAVPRVMLGPHGEKSLMLGKMEGKRRTGWQRMRCLDGITDSMDMSLSKLRETVEDRGAWCALDTTWRLKNNNHMESTTCLVLDLACGGVWWVFQPFTRSSSGVLSQVICYYHFYVTPQSRYYCCYFTDEKTKDFDPREPWVWIQARLQPLAQWSFASRISILKAAVLQARW